MRVLIVGLCVATAVLSGCGEKVEKPVDFTVHTGKELSPEQVGRVQAAAATLFEKCAALKEYLPDVVDNKAQIYDADGFSEKRDFGWSEFVQFDLLISETPKKVPSEYRASGHHCLFRVSGDEVAVQKAMCGHICKGEPSKATNSYSFYIGKANLGKDTPQPKPAPLYSMNDGTAYGYEQAVSEEAKQRGQVASKLMMVKFLGEREGILQFHSKDGSIHLVYQCQRPCEFVKQMVFYDQELQRKDHLRAVNGSIAWAMARDAMNGHMKQYTKVRDGKLSEVWFEETGPKWRPIN